MRGRTHVISSPACAQFQSKPSTSCLLDPCLSSCSLVCFQQLWGLTRNVSLLALCKLVVHREVKGIDALRAGRSRDDLGPFGALREHAGQGVTPRLVQRSQVYSLTRTNISLFDQGRNNPLQDDLGTIWRTLARLSRTDALAKLSERKVALSSG